VLYVAFVFYYAITDIYVFALMHNCYHYACCVLRVKVFVVAGLQDSTQQLLGGKGKKGKGKSAAAEVEEAPTDAASSIKIVLNFKKYIFDTNKRMVQT
jgi:hypothetical protein